MYEEEDDKWAELDIYLIISQFVDIGSEEKSGIASHEQKGEMNEEGEEWKGEYSTLNGGKERVTLCEERRVEQRNW